MATRTTTTDHDAILHRVLPHVDKNVIRRARQTITELDWNDNDDGDTQDPRFLAPTPSSLLTRTDDCDSVSTVSFTTGLCPPPLLYLGDFHDGASEHDDMPPPAAAAAAAVAQHPALELPGPEARRAVRAAARNTISGPSRGGAGAGAGAAAASDGMHGVVDVPTRHSSRYTFGSSNTNAASTTDKPLPPITEPLDSAIPEEEEEEEQVAVRGEEEEEEEEDEEEEESRNGYVSIAPSIHARSTATATSSTPPPIANNRPSLMYDHDDFGAAHHNAHDQYAQQQQQQQHPSTFLYEEEADSVRSRRSYSSPQQQQPRPNGSVLADSLRSLRTPVLDHNRLYHDAEPRRPLLNHHHHHRTVAAQRQTQPQQKLAPIRSIDDGIYFSSSSHHHHQHDRASNSNSASVPSSLLRGGGGSDARNPSLRRTYSDDELSMRRPTATAASDAASTTTGSGTGSHRSATAAAANMPDFFSPAVFQVVLHNPTTAHQLLRFSETRFCAENVDFLARVDEYRATLNALAGQMAAIHKTFVAPGAPAQVNVAEALLRQAHRDMKALITAAFPAMETLFADLQDQIETLVFHDVYPRFVRHQMALSAARALAADRFKYQGLGDCFCLTNPHIADNPIVFASDGFVKVTGYTRPEIIPRNCRFLQGAHTDRQAVARLKTAIHERKESVELLLNYKKNGDPFWNLLYTVPLFNSKGKLDFFLGGQVNCSTTIHSNADVMRVLSVSNTAPSADDDDSVKAASVLRQPAKPSARQTLLKAFGMRHDHHQPHHALEPTEDAGMEDDVLGRMQGRDLDAQMKEFYSAYSRFLVVRTSTWTIEFYSDGIVQSLNPANLSRGLIAGTDVFRFLGHNMLSKQNDYKQRVRSSIRAGIAVSTPLRLQTKRSAVFRGDESFAVHWTPLKDEKAGVHWVVISMAPMGG